LGGNSFQDSFRFALLFTEIALFQWGGCKGGGRRTGGGRSMEFLLSLTQKGRFEIRDFTAAQKSSGTSTYREETLHRLEGEGETVLNCANHEGSTHQTGRLTALRTDTLSTSGTLGWKTQKKSWRRQRGGKGKR